MSTTGRRDLAFDDVISAWQERLRCQSVYGCRRQATWRAIRHKPCDGQLLVCTVHFRKYVQAAELALAYTGLMECPKCGAEFSAPEQCLAFRPL